MEQLSEDLLRNYSVYFFMSLWFFIIIMCLGVLLSFYEEGRRIAILIWLGFLIIYHVSKSTVLK